MLVYRIVHKKFSKFLSASGLKGRWNSAGNKVIYCAESIPLAFLENMIRRKGVGFNDDFKIMIIEIPANLKIDTVDLKQLPAGWRDYKDYSKCQLPGDEWYNRGETSVLKVPSAVLTEAFNYLINTHHADYKKIKFIETTNLVPDERIEEILKKYSGP
jgi:RES domain-containing protein